MSLQRIFKLEIRYGSCETAEKEQIDSLLQSQTHASDSKERTHAYSQAIRRYPHHPQFIPL